MTAAEAAVLLAGRPVGAGRWIARCPAHADRAPSLRISEGRDGRVLLHCFAGCSLQAVVRAGGLTIRTLFSDGPKLTASECAAAQQAQARHRAAAAAQRRTARTRIDLLRTQWHELNHATTALGARLALLPDGTPGGDALAACFHDLLAELRLVDGALTGDHDEF